MNEVVISDSPRTVVAQALWKEFNYLLQPAPGDVAKIAVEALTKAGYLDETQ